MSDDQFPFGGADKNDERRDGNLVDGDQFFGSAETASPTAASPTAARLHSLRGISWSTFFGGTLPAGILVSLNYYRLGKKRQAAIALGVAWIVTLLILAGIYSLPDDVDIPNSAFYFPILLVTSWVAKWFQGGLFEKHRREGGEFVSSWRSIGVAILCYPVIFGIAIAFVILDETSYGTELVVDGDTVYFIGDIGEGEARQLAKQLQEEAYFDGTDSFIQFGRDDGLRFICFPLQQDAWNSVDVQDYYRALGRRLANTFGWDEVVIRLTDAEFEPYKEFVETPQEAPAALEFTGAFKSKTYLSHHDHSLHASKVVSAASLSFAALDKLRRINAGEGAALFPVSDQSLEERSIGGDALFDRPRGHEEICHPETVGQHLEPLSRQVVLRQVAGDEVFKKRFGCRLRVVAHHCFVPHRRGEVVNKVPEVAFFEVEHRDAIGLRLIEDVE